MRTARIVITGAAALALVAGGTAAGATIAAGPVDGSGVIHGCYTTKASNGSHTLVLQNTATTCPAADTAIKWNQKGPAGPAGPAGSQGPAGATGPAGPQGPAGVANVDRGILSWSNGGSPGQTCALAQLAGPDAAGMTATGAGDPAFVCTIDGLQPGSIVTVSGFGGIGDDSAGLLDIAGGSLQVWTSGSSGQLSFIAIIPGS